MNKSLLVLMLLCSVFLEAQVSPGGLGLTNLTAWWKADGLTNGNATAWGTTFPTGVNAITVSDATTPFSQVTNTPIGGIFNYNKLVDFNGNSGANQKHLFNGGSFNLLTNQVASDQGTFFTVYAQPTAGADDGVVTWRGTSTNAIQMRGWGRLAIGQGGNTAEGTRDFTPSAVRKPTVVSYKGNKSVGGMTGFKDGLILPLIGWASSQALMSPGLTFGAKFTGGTVEPFSGYLAEVIFYNTDLTNVEMNRVESYLAIKYAITLGTPLNVVDYNSSTGVVIWDGSVTPNYHNQIIGIGRDDSQGLYQKQSHTFDDSLRIYVDALAATNEGNTGVINTNISYVTVGHNTDGLCGTNTSNPEAPFPISSRIEREFKVTNTAFDQDFNMDLTLGPCNPIVGIDLARIRLMVDLDGDFSNATLYSQADGITFSENNGVISVSGISTTHIPINSTRYVTIGYIDLSYEVTETSGPICEGEQGWAILDNFNDVNPVNIQYSDGTNSFSVANVVGGDTVFLSPVTTTSYTFGPFTGLINCCSAGVASDTTVQIVVQQTVVADFDYLALCEGDEITFTNTSTGNYNNSQWIFINGLDTIRAQDAAYTFPTGSSMDVQLIIEDAIENCSDTIIIQVVEPLALMLSVDNQVDVTCNSGNDGIATVGVTQGTAPYSYVWTGSSSTTATADDLGFGVTTVTVTDANGCEITEDINIGQPIALSINAISQDTIICIGDAVSLSGQGAGGSTPYTYNWLSNNQVVGNGSNVSLTPNSTPTEYCLVLGEQCGSPQDTACVIVSYPGELVPTLVPDKTGECYPVEVNFTNSTNTTEDIAFTIWTYSDGDKDTTMGTTNTSHEFGLGIHNVSMEIVTDRGCKYFKSFNQLIEGYPYPVADFNLAPNPVSVLESMVGGFDQSGSNITSYKWYAEGAIPEMSTEQNPKFQFPNAVGVYPISLVVENMYGCTDTLEKSVTVESAVTIFAPNTFTPDGNNSNETWRVYILGIDMKNFHLEIFNRWGEIIFESFDAEGIWDGTYGNRIVQEGSYIWKVRAYDANSDKKHEFNGTINVLR